MDLQNVTANRKCNQPQIQDLNHDCLKNKPGLRRSTDLHLRIADIYINLLPVGFEKRIVFALICKINMQTNETACL